ncbi:hypothetical protein [Rhodococcus erythropolis]|uniref:hypothetical protein n=1 Tax=Rhodococcus erythropolis TaxID=1833 RepID=UPI00366E25BF
MAEPWGADPTAWVVDGRVVHVTRPPLIRLVNLVVTHTPIYVVFGSLRDPADEQFLIQQILDDDSPIENDFLNDVADELVEAWFGMPRWTVQEIWWRVLQQWTDIDGELQMRGVDLMALPPARATNLAKAVLMKFASGSDDRVRALLDDFTMEPPRIVRKHAEAEGESTSESVEAAAYDFNAAIELMHQIRG